MGRKKSKKDKKREAREQAAAEEQAALEAFEARRRLYRIAAVAVPVVTIAAAAGIYLGMNDQGRRGRRADRDGGGHLRSLIRHFAPRSDTCYPGVHGLARFHGPSA